jgi:hypothetical protein
MNIQTMIHISEVTLLVVATSLAMLVIVHTLQNYLALLNLSSVSWNR